MTSLHTIADVASVLSMLIAAAAFVKSRQADRAANEAKNLIANLLIGGGGGGGGTYGGGGGGGGGGLFGPGGAGGHGRAT